MNSKNTTIELNGNLYDAVTGKMLGKGDAPKVPSSGHNIDGFFRGRGTTPAAHATTVHKTVAAPKSANVAVKAATKTARAAASHARAHQPQTSQRSGAAVKPAAKQSVAVTVGKKPVSANHHKAHQPQSATTLMRTAVKKPGASVRAQSNVQGALAAKKPGLIEVKRAAAAIDTDRLVRAGSVETSPMIAHHGKQVAAPAVSIAPLAVKPVPAPVKPQETVPPVAPAPQQNNNPKKQDIFDHALANAANFVDVKVHRAHFRKQTQRHVASVAAGTMALFVIAGFAFYQNSPGMQLKFASIQAGVATNMPNFAQAGFAYNGVKSDSGKVTVGFRDGYGKYQLSQQDTSWTSGDMIREVSATDAGGRPNYATVDANGTQVYRFNNTGATWVSGGKWYSVSGNNALSDDQIKRIVENV